jgi:ABC-type glycerol-3-phosphate transport system permease component
MATRLARLPSSRPVWMENPTIAGRVSKFIVLAIVVIVMLFPFVYVLSISFSSERDLSGANASLIPAHPTWAAYQQIFAGGIVTRALEVSVGVTAIGTVACMVMTTTLAYGLSRTSHVPGSKLVLLLVLGTLLFSPGIIPNYLLIRYLGLLNHYAALIFPTLIIAFNLVVVRQFFMNIPEDLIDASVIDGCNPLQTFWHITLPLSKAVLAVIALFYGVGIWSDFFNALLYLNNTAMWPIQLVLRLYVLQGQQIGGTITTGQPPPPALTIQMAVVVVATVPILLVYPFLQKYFTQGVLSGAIKG